MDGYVPGTWHNGYHGLHTILTVSVSPPKRGPVYPYLTLHGTSSSAQSCWPGIEPAGAVGRPGRNKWFVLHLALVGPQLPAQLLVPPALAVKLCAEGLHKEWEAGRCQGSCGPYDELGRASAQCPCTAKMPASQESRIDTTLNFARRRLTTRVSTLPRSRSSQVGSNRSCRLQEIDPTVCKLTNCLPGQVPAYCRFEDSS